MSNPYEHLWIYYFEGAPEKNTLERAMVESYGSAYVGAENNNGEDSGNGAHQGTFIGNWEEDGFSFLFFSAPCDEAIDLMLSKNSGLKLIDRYEMSGEQWHGEKIESYTTGSLCISPPWKIPFVNRPGIKHILLDPGVVFGTGRHPTTEDCLGLMEKICRSEEIKTAMDIGTGTGLLSLAAAAFGVRKVLAFDFNLLAVKTTHHNIKINSFEDQILAFQAKAEDFAEVEGDLAVANIHFDVMKNLIEMPGFINHRWLILSGLLRSEVGRVISGLEKRGVNIIDTLSPDGVWNTVLAGPYTPDGIS